MADIPLTRTVVAPATSTSPSAEPSKNCSRVTWPLPTPEQFAALGFNTSSLHVDIVSTLARPVTATVKNGSTMLIYAAGQLRPD
jgi:hypothetical protein